MTELRASDGSVLQTISIPGVSFVDDVAFDGANIWVPAKASNSITKLRASDDKLLGTFTVGGAPERAAFGGTHIWVSNLGGNSVTILLF